MPYCCYDDVSTVVQWGKPNGCLGVVCWKGDEREMEGRWKLNVSVMFRFGLG